MLTPDDSRARERRPDSVHNKLGQGDKSIFIDWSSFLFLQDLISGKSGFSLGCHISEWGQARTTILFDKCVLQLHNPNFKFVCLFFFFFKGLKL